MLAAAILMTFTFRQYSLDRLVVLMREGKTKREAFRALKRYIARAVFRLWQECLAVPAPAPAATAA